MTLTRAQTLPPGYVAQPVGGGEHNGIKWELDRVYDPTGRLDRNRTYWEIRQVLADDLAPRSVAYAEVAPVGVTFAEFTRLTTPLERVERWIALVGAPRWRAAADHVGVADRLDLLARRHAERRRSACWRS